MATSYHPVQGYLRHRGVVLSRYLASFPPTVHRTGDDLRSLAMHVITRISNTLRWPWFVNNALWKFGDTRIGQQSPRATKVGRRDCSPASPPAGGLVIPTAPSPIGGLRTDSGSGGIEGMGWRDGRVANGGKTRIQTLVVSNLAVTADSWKRVCGERSRVRGLGIHPDRWKTVWGGWPSDPPARPSQARELPRLRNGAKLETGSLSTRLAKFAWWPASMGVLRLEYATAVKKTDAHQRVDASSEEWEVRLTQHGKYAG